MKIHTQGFKEQIKQFGRELDSKITYSLNGEDIELGSEELNSITPHYQANILKSVMKQLDIDSNVDIPLETILNYKFGLKVNGNYEYINFGNYIVYSSEKQEDTNSYKIICYDKMLWSMKPYESFVDEYPISINDYIDKLCQKLGLVFKNKNDNYANKNKMIDKELYLDNEGNSLDYTYRDVFDELAQVTASTIVINEETDELEIRYINDTEDVIDEEYLKDVNVTFGEKYGPVNSIVLSRAAESDNIYLQDEDSIEENGLCELKIKDNQIMNFNNRNEFLPDILEKLNGLKYYINDYSSTGITYYNVCDKYSVSIGDNIYPCVMLNDEVDVTQGLEEKVYTEMPDKSETDYTKADKEDRKINQTYLIVDKQNQIIESTVSQVSKQEEKITQVIQDVNKISSEVSEKIDVTVESSSTQAEVDFIGISNGTPINMVVYPIGESISYIYPRNNLNPSNNLFMSNRTIRFTNATTNEIFDYELPSDLLYYNKNIYDKFELDYDNQKCIVTKRVSFNADGSISPLNEEEVIEYEYPNILFTKGNYTVKILSHTSGYIYLKMPRQNDYTDLFATKVEVSSSIEQTANSINLSVDEKLGGFEKEIHGELELKVGKNDNDQIVSMINASADEINLTSNRFSMTSDYSKIDKNGIVEFTGGNIGGWNISESGLNNGNYYINKNGYSNIYTTSDLLICQMIILKIVPEPESGSTLFNFYDVNHDGIINSTDLLILQKMILGQV